MTIEHPPMRFDPVENPAHYNKNGGIEAIESIEASMTQEAFKGFLKGNVLKYVWRYEAKNGLQDLQKAKWYLDRLVFMLELESEKEALDAIEQSSMECKDGFCPMPGVRYDKPPESGVVFPPIKD
jgi:hypothetical protein